MNLRILRLLIIIRDTAQRLIFIASAMLPPYRPRRGITLIGPMRDGGSFSKVMRDFAIGLKEAGLPYQTFDLGLKKNVSLADTNGALTPWWKFRSRQFDHVIELYSTPFPEFSNHINATVIFWEAESGFPEAHPEVLHFRQVIAMSDYNATYFQTALPAKVHKVIYPFRMPTQNIPSRERIRERFKIKNDTFVVFFNYNISSDCGRKNPEGAISAFAKAFPSEPNTRLVFKTMHAKIHPEVIERLNRQAAELGIADRFSVITDYLPHDELYGLTAACDCYMSLHRGEGFGLGMAEAMSLGVPVVATNYSANTEFCNTENSIPISYRIISVPAEHRYGAMAEVTHWADPDLDAAARALRRLYEDPAFRTRLGAAGKAFIADYFSLENFKKSVEEFLDGK